MAYRIKNNSTCLTLMFTPEPGDSIMRDVACSVDKTVFLLDELEEPVYLIIDLRRVWMDVEEFVTVAGVFALGAEPLVRHQKVRETLFVSSHPGMRVAVGGLTSPVFGRVRVSYFATMEEAHAHCGQKDYAQAQSLIPVEQGL